MTQQLKHSYAKRAAKLTKVVGNQFKDMPGVLNISETDAKEDPGMAPLPEPTYTPLGKRKRGDKVSVEDI